jgi:hypothetical protein
MQYHFSHYGDDYTDAVAGSIFLLALAGQIE